MFANTKLKTISLNILINDLKYSPGVPGIQNATLSATLTHVSKNRGNEYDVAVIFLASQLALLGNPLDLDLSNKMDRYTLNFLKEKCTLIQNIKYKLTMYGDVEEFIEYLSKLLQNIL